MFIQVKCLIDIPEKKIHCNDIGKVANGWINSNDSKFPVYFNIDGFYCFAVWLNRDDIEILNKEFQKTTG